MGVSGVVDLSSGGAAQCAEHGSACLDGGAAMVKTQGTQAAEFFTATCAARATVQRLRHDVAVARMKRRHVR
jgi:hypothetical protein